MKNDGNRPPLIIAGVPAAEINKKLFGHRGRLRARRAILDRVRYSRAGVAPDDKVPGATVYLQPDAEHVGLTGRDALDIGEVWMEATPSSGLRSVDHVSKSSFRGHVPYRGQNSSLSAESMIEARLAKILQVHRSVIEIRSQYPRVQYVDDGTLRETVFDFWVMLSNQQRVAVAVKPARKVRSSGILRTLRLVSDQGIGGYADAVALFTDARAGLDDEYNAAWILRSRRMFSQAEYDHALERVSVVHGSTRFHDLLAGAACQAARRTAIWNLIDQGELEPEEHGRIEDLSWLRRSTFH